MAWMYMLYKRSMYFDYSSHFCLQEIRHEVLLLRSVAWTFNCLYFVPVPLALFHFSKVFPHRN